MKRYFSIFSIIMGTITEITRLIISDRESKKQKLLA